MVNDPRRPLAGTDGYRPRTAHCTPPRDGAKWPKPGVNPSGGMIFPPAAPETAAMTTTSPPETASGAVPRALPRYLVAWACGLALLPAVLGILFVGLELYPVYRVRFFWFVGPWAAFGFATILMAMAFGFAPVRALVSRSRPANIALIVLLALLALALLRYDPVNFWKPLRSLLLIQAFLVGCAAYFLARREG